MSNSLAELTVTGGCCNKYYNQAQKGIRQIHGGQAQ